MKFFVTYINRRISNVKNRKITGVTVTLKDNVVTVKGPKGELSQFVDPSINVSIEDGHVMLTENENAMLDNVKQRHAFHGL